MSAPAPLRPTAVRPGARPPVRRPKPFDPVERLHRWLAGKPQPRTGPPLPANLAIVSTCMTILAALLLGIVGQLTIVGNLQHNRDQQIAYDDLRLALAQGTAPVAPPDGKPLAKGTPIARVEIPAIGLKEIVLEGTTATVLRSGVGHRRDTVMPGQAGTSIVMGRRLGYGGPFSELPSLNTGDTIKVTTGQGVANFRVLGVRRTGDPQQGLAAGGSRLTLITSAGSRFAPGDALRVDADLEGQPFPAAIPYFRPGNLPGDERVLASEADALNGAVGWGVLLALAGVGVTWLRLNWGRWQAWLIGLPTLGFLGISAADHVCRLLPNLL